MRSLVVLVVAVCVASCASRPVVTTVPAALKDLSPREQLRRDLQALFTDPSTDRAHWSVNFSSLQNAELLYSLNSFRFMVPGSIQKTLTVTTAAERLGWDYRYTTRVLSTAPIGADGRIDGDVVIVGSGDPSINPRHPDRWRAFDDWALALEAKGVRSITGRLVGDDNAFAEPGWGFGWSWDDLHYGYGAEPSALQYNENKIEVMIGPGMTPGSRAIISTSPYGHGLVVNHEVTTAAAGERTLVDLSRMPGSVFLTVRGQIAVDAKPITVDASVENPTRLFVTALREALARHGILVAGGVVDIDELPAPYHHEELHELIVDRAPPLSELIDVTLKWSRNIYAETLLLSMAPPSHAATAARGLEAMRETLRSWAVPADFYIARDGSGLSRYNYMTGDAMVWLLTYLWADPKHAALFQSTLPVAGVSGTLANRLRGTAAEGRVRAKTGTMSHVRSLAGYVTTLEGETIVFSMIANDFRVSSAEIDALMDKALERVVQFTRH